MFPLRDLNPASRRTIMVPLLVAINVLVFVHELSLGPGIESFTQVYGAVPQELSHGRALLSALTSMFVHGGFMHIIGNMWFLWIFGDNVEDAFGRVAFVIFYLLCGFGAVAAQVALTPDSDIAMIGASGAIAGVLAAYVRLYPQARILTLFTLLIFFRIIEVPAYFFILVWFGYQLLLSILAGTSAHGGVAFIAHVGGFVCGLVLTSVFRPRQSKP